MLHSMFGGIEFKGVGMNEALVIEELNQDIKGIVSLAESVALAVNEAQMEATQAGIKEVGISFIARELRTFSEKMAVAMHSLSALIFWQMEVNAGKRWQGHVPAQADADEMEQLIVSQVCDVQVGLMRTAKQCAAGLLIVRSGDMGDIHSGVMTPELHRIVQEVEEAVSYIALRVKNLEARLAEAGLWKTRRLFVNPVGTD
jgi:hypothetical protein